MSDQQLDDFERLWREAIEKHIAGMSAEDFQALVHKVRPQSQHVPPGWSPTDPALQMRAVTDSIAAKRRLLPQVDHNGHPIKKGPAQ